MRDYYNTTTIHPLALASLALLCLLTLTLRRKYALLPTLVLVCFIPSAQRIVVLGLDFTLLRIIAGVGLVRVLARGEYATLRWQRADTAVVAWAAASLFAYVSLRGTTSAMIYICGVLSESLGLYFMTRCLLRTWSDLQTFALGLVAVGVIVGFAFLVEKSSSRNPFSVFGGVPAITIEREGRLRCQGAFSHSILAGCFWAGMAPYMAALWWSKSQTMRLAAPLGVASAFVIIFACSSSTPAASMLAGILAGLWFCFRHYSRLLRYSVAMLLVALHLAMNAPLWHLMARIDIVGGSTGYHRYALIDAAIRRFWEWMLIGTKTTAHWGQGLYDVTNQYIGEGVKGGVLRLVLFVLVICMCFSRVGHMWRALYRDREKSILSWALGVALFTHCVSFLGVTYFGQITFGWYFSLAAIVSLSEPLHTQARPSLARGRELRTKPSGRVAYDHRN